MSLIKSLLATTVVSGLITVSCLADDELVKKGEEIYAKIENMELRLPKDKAAKVAGYVGKSVWFGIRPEHVGSRETHPEENENFIKAEVYVVEQMGNEVYVYFSPGRNQYIARLEAGVTAKSGEIYELWFDTTKCHIFDKETELNITL